MDYTLKIFRIDRRCKNNQRLIGTYSFDRKSDEAMEREVKELRLHHYPTSQYILEFQKAYKTVKSLMTGKDVEIAYDTPYCCDPSKERYWTM